MIQFTQPLDPSRLRMAYNNDVVRFYSDTGTAPLYANISIGNLPDAPTVRLYPNPQGQFYFNFKPYITALINTKNFEDTLQTNLIAADTYSFVYSAESGHYTDYNVTFFIDFGEGITDTATHLLSWLAAAQQLGNFTRQDVNSLKVLSPALPTAANTAYLKYWEGYPFCISLYSNEENISLRNTTHAMEQQFTIPGKVSRLFFSDGRTDESLEDIIPVSVGHNNLCLQRSGYGIETAFFIQLEKASPCRGVYLKWLNAQGGYSYWLFENTYAVDRSAKDRGELNRDFENPENSFGSTTQIGRTVQDTIKIVAELLTPPQRDIVQNLLESPKVYLFTGLPYSRSDYRSWVEVSVKTTSARIKNAREELTNFTFDIELPVRYGVSL